MHDHYVVCVAIAPFEPILKSVLFLEQFNENLFADFLSTISVNIG